MSIFAKQLHYVLDQHEKTFGQLYNIRVEEDSYNGRFISAEKIKRLKLGILDEYQHTITLNRSELETVQKVFSFKPVEIRRLRAALAAESILRFLLDRIEYVKAVQVSEVLFHLLFDADDSTFVALRSRMVEDIRTDDSDSREEITDEQEMRNALEVAIEAYENALLWLDTARITQSLILRQGYLAMISSLLGNAQDLLAYPPASVYGTPQLAEWRQAVAQAMIEMNAIEAM